MASTPLEIRVRPAMLSDEEVIARVLAGDHALFELIMRRHNQRLYRTIRAILREDTEVEDVMQQAYVNAYAHLRQFAGEARFSTWLTRIAVNEALARMRRRRLVVAENGSPGQDPMANVQSSEMTPEENASNEQLRGILEQAILALPDTYRLLFVMRELDGLSTEEAAEALNVSTDVVKTRLHRARGMLREKLLTRAGLLTDSLFLFGDTRCNHVSGKVMEETALTAW